MFLTRRGLRASSYRFIHSANIIRHLLCAREGSRCCRGIHASLPSFAWEQTSAYRHGEGCNRLVREMGGYPRWGREGGL